MKTKRIVIIAGSVLLIIYIAISFWIARDVRIILRSGMDNNTNYSSYMNEQAFDSINPIQRKMSSMNYTYHPEYHSIGVPLPLHFFGYAKVFVTHRYDQDNWGFSEPVNLTLKLKNGKWYATKVNIKP